MTNIKIKFLFFYIVTLVCVGVIVFLEKESKINSYLKEKTNNIKVSHDSLYHEYKKVADIIFFTQIKQQEIL